MSRAKRRLVFSATEPYLAPLGRRGGAASARPARAGRGAAAGRAAVRVPRRGAAAAAPATDDVVDRDAAGHGARASTGEPARRPATEAGGGERRASAGPSIARSSGSSPTPAIRLAMRPPTPRRASSAPPPAPVRRGVAAIVDHPDGARFFRGAQIRWSGNEVSVSDAGEVLRIDRLVARRRSRRSRLVGARLQAAATRPRSSTPYRAQLLRYRDAVARAQPGEIVRLRLHRRRRAGRRDREPARVKSARQRRRLSRLISPLRRALRLALQSGNSVLSRCRPLSPPSSVPRRRRAPSAASRCSACSARATRR